MPLKIMNDAQPTKTAHESPDIDEDPWGAWLQKGRKQDRVRRYRLAATIYVFIILASCAVIWMYLPFSRETR
jgi:hypothetical protein